jgi:hypothetical protein
MNDAFGERKKIVTQVKYSDAIDLELRKTALKDMVAL